MKLSCFGNKNSLRRWMLISLRRITLTTSDICMERKVNRQITSHGAAIKFWGKSLQARESIMDVPSRLCLRII
jgi:hypothetical protein